MIDHLLKVVRIKEVIPFDDPVILEVGACRGTTTAAFLSVYPRVKLFCFEPDPRNIIKFNERVKGRCKLYETVVSDIDGFVTLHQSSGRHPTHPPDWVHSDGSSIKGTKPQIQRNPWLKYLTSIQVESIRLDTWAAQEGIKNIDFIWADVEGAEENLIKGAQRVLANTHYLYTEFSNTESYEGQINLDMIMKLLPNFELIKKWKNDVLLRNKMWRKFWKRK